MSDEKQLPEFVIQLVRMNPGDPIQIAAVNGDQVFREPTIHDIQGALAEAAQAIQSQMILGTIRAAQEPPRIIPGVGGNGRIRS